MALHTPTSGTSVLPPAVVAEINSDMQGETFLNGTEESTIVVPCADRKLRRNRAFQVKELANAVLVKNGQPVKKPDTGYVIRSRTHLKGTKLEVTLYWGPEVQHAS